MRYIVRRNFRHNGKLYAQGDKPDIVTPDEQMRMRIRSGALEVLPVKTEKHPGEPKKTDAPKEEVKAPADAANTSDEAPKTEEKKPGIMDKIGDAISGALGNKKES